MTLLKPLLVVLSISCVWAQPAYNATPWQMRVYTNVADLVQHGSPLSVNKSVHVMGYVYPNDGGGGDFVVTNTITATNLGTRIYSGTTGLSYERVLPDANTLNPLMFGADASGSADSYAATTNAYAVANTLGRDLLFSSGTYKYTKKLLWDKPVSVFGVPKKTTLKPTTAVVTPFITLNSELDGTLGNIGKRILVSGLILNGISATTNLTGLYLGDSILNSEMTILYTDVINFTGTNGIGVGLGQIVGVTFMADLFAQNGINLRTVATDINFPTTLAFYECKFKSAQYEGVLLDNGQMQNFYKCVFESNGREGFKAQSRAGGTLIDTRLQDYWFEGNYLGTALALRTNLFSAIVDGAAPTSGCQVSFVNGRFVGGPTTERALYMSYNTDLVLDHPRVQNIPGNILIDPNSRGYIHNWDENNSGPLQTTVSNLGTVVYLDRGFWHMKDMSLNVAEASSPNDTFTFKANTFGEALQVMTATVTNNHPSLGDILTLDFFPANAGAVLPPYIEPYLRLANIKDRHEVPAGTVLATTNFYAVLTNSGAIILPSVALGGAGAIKVIKADPGVTATVTPSTGDSIDFGASDTLAPLLGGIYISDGGTNWERIYLITGETNTMSNLGTGNGVYNSKSGVDLRLNSLKAGANITITSNANELTFAAAAGSGEANTASNLGTGNGVYNSKSGVDLRFNSLKQGSNITISSNANELTIAATIAYPTATAGETFNKTGGLYTNTTTYALIDFQAGSDLNITLPSSGTYLVSAMVDYYSGGSTFVQYYKLRNTTDASDVANSEYEYSSDSAAANRDHLIMLQNIITVAASKVIAVYGKTTDATYDHMVNATNSWVRYIKLN